MQVEPIFFIIDDFSSYPSDTSQGGNFSAINYLDSGSTDLQVSLYDYGVADGIEGFHNVTALYDNYETSSSTGFSIDATTGSGKKTQQIDVYDSFGETSAASQYEHGDFVYQVFEDYLDTEFHDSVHVVLIDWQVQR